MVSTVITLRRARPEDAAEIAETHDCAWREAYRGVIPGRELERMIARRGPRWWRSAILRGASIAVVDFDESIAGYVSYGRNRMPALDSGGEIFELYLAPEFQGLGFGRRLFDAARRDLAAHGFDSFIVWALVDNERAVAFYERMGGQATHRTQERFGEARLARIGFTFSKPQP